MAGQSIFFDNSNYIYPKPLLEVRGKPMIQHVIENLSTISEEINFIFAVNASDCRKYHIDNVLNLLTDNKSIIISVENDTAGAACTALLAIDEINNDDPLIISNADQCFDGSLDMFISSFKERNLDAGVVCFDSVHPRWSYARLEDGQIVEASEKRPISRQAIAGLFYFKHGQYFVEAAMKSIYNDASVEGNYYVAPVINELVLGNKTLGICQVENKDYHTFYSPQLLEEYNRA